MPANYVLLASVTTTATVATIDLLNIPQTGYTDLVVTWTTRTPNTTPTIDNLLIAFNGSAGNGLTEVLSGNGTSASQFTDTGTYTGAGTNGGAATANTFSNGQLYIGDYASSTKFKNMQLESVTENAGTTAGTALATFVYQLTTPISSITLVPNFANFSADSTFTIYGVAVVGQSPTAKASGGDIIINNGTYWYHAFLSTGTFTAIETLSCDILQIGSGGGGGSNRGGGGGAGGIRVFTSQSLVAGSYIAAVGAGGSGGGGTSGNASQFHNFTVSPGGGRGGNSQGAGLTGASGGGGGNELQSNPTPAGGSATLGNVGGTCDPSNKLTTGGGGGGFGSAGGNGSSSTGGTGGAGVNTYSAWATATGTGVSGFYAGGGGGYGSGAVGVGGSGGGGNGGAGTANNGSSGVIATGSGGGATNDSGVAYNGGSGLVIVRYAV